MRVCVEVNRDVSDVLKDHGRQVSSVKRPNDTLKAY